MTDSLSKKSGDVGGGSDSSSRMSYFRRFFSWMLAWATVGSPFVIVTFIVLALIWGAGLRMIIEAFQFGWDLFGF